MEHSQASLTSVKNILVIDKDVVKEALKKAKKGEKKALEVRKALQTGDDYANEDVGWWRGRIALLELLTKMKGLKYGDV